MKIKTPDAKPGILPKVVIGVLILAVLIFLGIYYKDTFVGKVITTPQLEPTDLNRLGTEGLDFSLVTTGAKFNITLSEGSRGGILVLQVEKEESGLVSYGLSSSAASGEELTGFSGTSSGLLGGEVMSSGPLFLNGDIIPDIELSLAGTVLTIKNLNFVSPDTALIKAYAFNFRDLGNNILYAETNQEAVYFFNATSSSMPIVTAFWKGGSPVNFTTNATGTGFMTIRVNQTLSSTEPKILVVNASVGDKSTLKEFIFAMNGLVYNFSQEGATNVKLMKKGEGNFNITYLFTEIDTVLQPVALLCGSFDLETKKDKIAVVFTYDGAAQVWREGIPSEFRALELGKGYLLRLKNRANLDFTVYCNSDQKPNQRPAFSLPSGLEKLDKTWNLIGVDGYEPLPIEEVRKKLNFGKRITAIYEYSTQVGQTGPVSVTSTITALEPGKVYWIKVE